MVVVVGVHDVEVVVGGVHSGVLEVVGSGVQVVVGVQSGVVEVVVGVQAGVVEVVVGAGKGKTTSGRASRMKGDGQGLTPGGLGGGLLTRAVVVPPGSVDCRVTMEISAESNSIVVGKGRLKRSTH